jgi:hypothetical protein
MIKATDIKVGAVVYYKNDWGPYTIVSVRQALIKGQHIALFEAIYDGYITPDEDLYDGTDFSLTQPPRGIMGKR